MRVAIVALGASAENYMRAVETAGGKEVLFDETWAINGFGNVFRADRTFAMDDIKVQEARGASGNLKIGNLAGSLKNLPGPVYTSRAYPDYPNMVPYPLEHVCNVTRVMPYFNNTVAYAIAFAIACPIPDLGIADKVESIYISGADFMYPGMPLIEQGRGCCEFWCGYAMAKGIDINVPQCSTLMGACEGNALYGYDSQTVEARVDEDGRIKLTYRDVPLPHALAIEQRYDKRPKIAA